MNRIKRVQVKKKVQKQVQQRCSSSGRTTMRTVVFREIMVKQVEWVFTPESPPARVGAVAPPTDPPPLPANPEVGRAVSEVRQLAEDFVTQNKSPGTVHFQLTSRRLRPKLERFFTEVRRALGRHRRTQTCLNADQRGVLADLKVLLPEYDLGGEAGV